MAAKKGRLAQFEPNEYVVYPAHGVGRIVSQDELRVGGVNYRCWVINFERKKMTLRVTLGSLGEKELRKLSNSSTITQVINVLNAKPRANQGMWNQKARAYNQKIHSGDLIALAEVIRDLYKRGDDGEIVPSYSEHLLYREALDRLVDEIAAIKGITDTEAMVFLNASCKQSNKNFTPEYAPPIVPVVSLPRQKKEAPYRRPYVRNFEGKKRKGPQ